MTCHRTGYDRHDIQMQAIQMRCLIDRVWLVHLHTTTAVIRTSYTTTGRSWLVSAHTYILTVRFVLVIVCIILCMHYPLYLFSSWGDGNFPLQSYWSLSCDHGLHCSHELMWEQQRYEYCTSSAWLCLLQQYYCCSSSSTSILLGVWSGCLARPAGGQFHDKATGSVPRAYVPVGWGRGSTSPSFLPVYTTGAADINVRKCAASSHSIILPSIKSPWTENHPHFGRTD